MWSQRAEPAREALAGLLRLIVVQGCAVSAIRLLSAAGDSLPTSIMDNATAMAGTGSQSLGQISMSAVGSATLVIVLSGLAIIAFFVQLVLLIVAAGLLVLMAGTLPLSAAASMTPVGNSWFRKSVGWLLAFLLFKPVAALVYGAAILSVTNSSDITGEITGIVLVALATLTLPALMRMVAPMVSAIGNISAASAAGMVAGVASGAVAIVATGGAAGPMAGAASGTKRGTWAPRRSARPARAQTIWPVGRPCLPPAPARPARRHRPRPPTGLQSARGRERNQWLKPSPASSTAPTATGGGCSRSACWASVWPGRSCSSPASCQPGRHDGQLVAGRWLRGPHGALVGPVAGPRPPQPQRPAADPRPGRPGPRAARPASTSTVRGPLSRVPKGRCSLPGVLAQMTATEAKDAYGRPFGLLRHPWVNHASIVLTCAPDGAALVDEADVDGWVAHWGAWLANLGNEPGLVGAELSFVESAPDSGGRQYAQQEICDQLRTRRPPIGARRDPRSSWKPPPPGRPRSPAALR